MLKRNHLEFYTRKNKFENKSKIKKFHTNKNQGDWSLADPH